MSSDPELGTEFLLALTMPEEKKQKKTPNQPYFMFQAAQARIRTTGNPSAGQCPQALMIHLVGSSRTAAPQGCSGQDLCRCSSQQLFGTAIIMEQSRSETHVQSPPSLPTPSQEQCE